MVNLRNFKFNSNMKMDNVVFVTEQDFSSQSGVNSYVETTIANPFPFKPLCFGNFSLDGGNTWQDIDFLSTAGQGQLISKTSTISIYILHETYAATIKVRIYAFPPSTAGNINYTEPTPISNFYINTVNSYDNIIANGTQNLSASNSDQVIYTHNLGYIPRAMLWQETSTGIMRMFEASYGDTNYNAPIITTTQLKWRTNSAITIHYRIYGGLNG